MKGTLQKTTEANAFSYTVACQTCAAFRDDDPDIYYCEDQQSDFPALCERYRQAGHLAPMRTEWTVPDGL